VLAPHYTCKENAVERRKLLITSAVLTTLLVSGAYAQDKAAQQAEVKAKAMQTLQEFYKADPAIKDVISKAPPTPKLNP
jgi:hypothetical protein